MAEVQSWQRTGERACIVSSVEEKTIFGVLDHPLETLLEVLAGHCAAGQDRPLVRSDAVQLQALPND